MLSSLPHPTWAPTRQVVDVTPIHQEVPVLRVAERGHVSRERHAGTDVPPQRACRRETEQQQHSCAARAGAGLDTHCKDRKTEVLLTILLGCD